MCDNTYINPKITPLLETTAVLAYQQKHLTTDNYIKQLKGGALETLETAYIRTPYKATLMSFCVDWGGLLLDLL